MECNCYKELALNINSVKNSYLATSLIRNLVDCTLESGFTRICRHVRHLFDLLDLSVVGIGLNSLLMILVIGASKFAVLTR